MAGNDVVDEIAMHQETISHSTNSPLQLIRERELEISGRMLKAKREADEIVASARRRAAEIVSAAEGEGGSGAKDREATILLSADAEAKGLREQASAEASAIASAAASRMDAAVELIVRTVRG